VREGEREGGKLALGGDTAMSIKMGDFDRDQKTLVDYFRVCKFVGKIGAF
jgi:hypothetical protein